MMVNEWCMRLAKSVFSEKNTMEIRDLKVFKGIQLHNFENGGDELIFVYNSEGNGSETLFHVKIESEAGVAYYQATIRLAAGSAQAVSFNSKLSELIPWKLKKKDIYNSKLFHGTDFQVITALNGISEIGCSASLSLAKPTAAATVAWQSDMFLFDGGIQVAILSLENYTGNNSALPMGFESLHIYDDNALMKEINCELLLKKNVDMASEWDIQFYDNTLNVLAEMKGLRMYMYQAN